MKQTILAAEDEPSILENIVYALETEGFQVAAATTGGEALRLFRETQPVLIVLDVGLPDASGFELCREIRRTSSVPVVFLTARNAEVDRVVGLEIGGDDYVTKPFSPRELAARVKAILRRVQPVLPPAARTESAPTPPLAIDPLRAAAVYFGRSLPLSATEFRLLSAFAKHPGRVFSRSQLMDIAWEDPAASLERTVDAHIKTLRAKMRSVQGDIDPIETHRGLGYSLREQW
ncbi:MAG: two-component system response regulator CreB [Verrucomicrobiales bacterium]|nr:two-component system response regulator CreB [Verrucomicrobiales bacterium]